jgi:hypothetical protein
VCCHKGIVEALIQTERKVLKICLTGFEIITTQKQNSAEVHLMILASARTAKYVRVCLCESKGLP